MYLKSTAKSARNIRNTKRQKNSIKMARGTVIFLFILAIIATLLFGINLGKKLGVSQSTIVITPSPAPTITLTATPTLIATPSAVIKKTGITTYTDSSCGFSFSYPGSFIAQKSVNGQTTILTDPDDSSQTLAATCAASIPRPPVSSDKIEAIMLDKVPATLYHDQNAQDGSPRDEIIVKHPTNGMEIILAGYGETFQQALTSFKFIQ